MLPVATRLPSDPQRRHFLTQAFAVSLLFGGGCHSGIKRQHHRLFFTSDGRTAVVNADGTGLRYFDFQLPNQVTWQPGPFLSDGRRVIFLSMEARRDGPGRSFDEFYTQTPTHLWLHDLDRGTLTEIAQKERLAVFYTPALLLSDERLLVQVVRNRVGQLFSINLDGTEAREFTRAGEGLPYGLSLSPNRQRVAFHLASSRGYEIWTSDLNGNERVKVAGDPNHLYFGTSWSPDGHWILFQDCLHHTDPGHDASDICIGRADRFEHRALTQGQAHWFAATYGGNDRHGGGSNMPEWTLDGHILYSRRSVGAKVPWEFQASRPDTDHFNRDFKPEAARGGTSICRLDPTTGAEKTIIPFEEGVWKCRACPSADGHHLAYCQAATGKMTSLWISNAEGEMAREINRGHEGRGADHPRWLP